MDEIDIQDDIFEEEDGGYSDDDLQEKFDLYKMMRELYKDKATEKVEENRFEIIKDDEDNCVILHVVYTLKVTQIPYGWKYLT